MNTVTIEIPEGFTHSFGSTPEEIARNAKLELAIEMYREGKWSTGKSAEFTGMYIGDFMDVLRDRKVEKPYTLEMLEEDLAHARRRF